MKIYLPLIARILLSAIFLWSGLGKIMAFTATQQQIAGTGVPLPGLFTVSAILFELIGGLSVLLGYQARWGATALIVFLIPTTLLFHTHFVDPAQVGQFFKNLGIMGGLLMVACFGTGPISLDTRSQSYPVDRHVSKV